jgi:cell division protein ZapA (FtsZ GTPase activity inhibitor)
MEITLAILGQDITISCTPEEERRLRDLAAALEARLAGEGDSLRRLALTALSLLDEAQAARAALARAHGEIERLTDMVVEARLSTSAEPTDSDRGRVNSLRAPGAA